jgi:hypothetical protein
MIGRNPWWWVIPLLIFLFVPEEARPGEPARATALRWLAGCWKADGGEAGSGEYWMEPAGGTLLGISRTVRKGRTVAYEFMRIQEEDSLLVFIALPSGQELARFPCTALTERRAVFENPSHNFPQRVIYELRGVDRLVGKIEGIQRGTAKTVEFPMTRIPCDRAD